MEALALIIVVPVLLGLIPASIASAKGRNFALWWLYGILLFLPALIHSLLIQTNPDAGDDWSIRQGLRKCPYCAEYIKPDAVVCRFCGRSLAALADVPPMPDEDARYDMLEDDVAFTHAGNGFLLGFGPNYWAIWKKGSGGDPVYNFEYDDAGWAAAWLALNEMDNSVRRLSPREAEQFASEEFADEAELPQGGEGDLSTPPEASVIPEGAMAWDPRRGPPGTASPPETEVATRVDTRRRLHEVAEAPCEQCDCYFAYSVSDTRIIWQPGEKREADCRKADCQCHVSPLQGARSPLS